MRNIDPKGRMKGIRPSWYVTVCSYPPREKHKEDFLRNGNLGTTEGDLLSRFLSSIRHREMSICVLHVGATKQAKQSAGEPHRNIQDKPIPCFTHPILFPDMVSNTPTSLLTLPSHSSHRRDSARGIQPLLFAPLATASLQNKSGFLGHSALRMVLGRQPIGAPFRSSSQPNGLSQRLVG